MYDTNTIGLDRTLIRLALEEDIGSGDITSTSIFPPAQQASGRLAAKADGVIAGLAVAEAVFQAVDPTITFDPAISDGQQVKAGTTIARFAGPVRGLLAGERLALNFLQRMSGIATLTRQYVEAVAGTGAVILDTRKTVPGLRHFDKTAVVLGGGQNHRMGLYDMALIKENHIRAAGGITAAVNRVREKSAVPIEVEVTTLEELREALNLNLDRIMLDNMSLPMMREAVAITNGRTPLEASGNVTLQTVRAIAKTGVDFISSGSLTHSVKALDISMLFDQ